MSWRLYGARLEDADFGGHPAIYQPFTLARSTRVKAIRTWFILYNPTFTTMSMEIWDDRAGAPATLLHTFDKTWTKAELLLTEGYGAKEFYFDFLNARWLRKGTMYHLVPKFTGQTFDASSHLAWVHGYPDPNTDIGITLSNVNIPSAPFWMSVIGDDR